MTRVMLLSLIIGVAAGFVARPLPARLDAARELALRERTLLQPAVPRQEALVRTAALHARVRPVTMGLFGLGTPELAVIAGIALLVLGPDQVKKLAKDVGKVSAELKQVPEEFNKGMEVGQQELAAKKQESVDATPPPASPPPAAPPASPPTA